MVFSRTFPDDTWLLEVMESLMVLQSQGLLASDSSWWGTGCEKSTRILVELTLRGARGVVWGDFCFVFEINFSLSPVFRMTQSQ